MSRLLSNLLGFEITFLFVVDVSSEALSITLQQPLRQHFSQLISARDIMEDQMDIVFHPFGTIMKNWIVRQSNDRNIITPNNRWVIKYYYWYYYFQYYLKISQVRISPTNSKAYLKEEEKKASIGKMKYICVILHMPCCIF